MKLKPQFTTMLRDVYAHAGEPEALSLLATYYWRGLLLLMFASLTIIFVFGTWALSGVLGDISTPAAASTIPQPPLNKIQLTQVLDGFSKRQTDYDILTKSGTNFSDPSR